MGFGQRYPPTLRRPYRETIPNANVWKGEPAVNRRPRLDYRSNHESGITPSYLVHSQPLPIVPNGNLQTLPEGSYEAVISGSQAPQWNPVFPVCVPPVMHPSQDQYSPPGSYVQYIPVSVTPYPSLNLTESSSQQVFNSPHLVQPVPHVAVPNNFGIPKDVPPAFIGNGYSDATQAVPESQQNGAKYEMVWTGSHYAIQQSMHPNGTFQYAQQQQQPQIIPSHPNGVNHSQTLTQNNWSAPGPDMVRVTDSTNQQHLKYSQIHSELHELDTIKNLAFKFVEEYCPHISNTAYCHPPVVRSRHPDKASKQLVMGMESEQRVIGTFERYFAASHIPVFMLCHYPVTGFLQQHHKKEEDGKESSDPAPTSNRETVTLILVSHKFCVTAVTVSIISSNSDFSYIQRGVAKAAGHVAKCGRAVSSWLTSLNLAPDVREVLAFPNLRQSMMQRITRDKALQKSLSKVSLLHLDDLCAPFEEEWSTSALRHQFTEWMQKHVLYRPSSLSPIDVELFVGALLCPQLSRVDNMKNVLSLEPIPENPKYIEKEPTNAEDIGQLQLTINGVTMGFDEFMDNYVSCYYPNVETKTYRVPPLHFNIQSFKRGTDYLKGSEKRKRVGRAEKKKRSNGNPFTLEKQSSESDSEEDEISFYEEESDEEFMPSGRSYCWKAAPVTGRLHSSMNFNDDESSDSDDMSHRYRPSPIETVTLDSLPDHIVPQDFFEVYRNEKGHGKSGFDNFLKDQKNHPLPHLPVAATLRPASVSPQTNGAPMVLLTQSSKSRVSGKELPHLSSASPTAHAHIHASLNGFAHRQVEYSGQMASLGLRVHPISKPAAKRSPISREEAQALMLEDTSVLSDVMAKDARADEGENRVINAMELLGQNFGPMFIICSYQYNNYLNKLREEMFSKGEATRPTRAFGQIMRAEHDCLIFHKDIGVLVVCIKAIGDNFTDWNASEEQIMSSTAKILHKALKQLEREEAMIRHVTSDLKSRASLVCHSLVALPNMYRKQVDAALATDPDLAEKIYKLTYGRGTKSFLCLDELPNKNISVWDPPEESVFKKLLEWWKSLKSSLDSPQNAIDTKVYKHIIGRYCGLLSTVEVWSPNNPRVEVRSRSEAANLCAQRFSQVVLLPTQLQVLMSDHNRIYLYGPPGSGKTMLLILKAREWLLRGQIVILINSRWGSSDGYPYAYGILDRLKYMMTKDGVPHEHLIMINVDTSRFHHSLLSDVLPTRCVIVDEVTPATLPVIEHLSCLQVQNIWCAGLFLDRRPRTAHHFHAFKMERVMRCPPILQSLLKHTEKDAKFSAPYWDVYEEPSPKLSPSLKNMRKISGGRESDLGGEDYKKETSSDTGKQDDLSRKEETETQKLKYDADSVNERLAKLSVKSYNPIFLAKTDPELKTSPKPEELSSLISNKVLSGLPTDGPRPHIIDHELHNHIGLPSSCSACGKELADFLLSMVKSEFANDHSQDIWNGSGPVNDSSNKSAGILKNKPSLKGGDASRGKFRKSSSSGFNSGIFRKQNEVRTGATTMNSSAHGQSRMFDNRALTWSDVLIVTCDLSKNLPLLKYLQREGIPIEEMPSSRAARRIETSKDRQRLFVTTYREVIGLERALIVFVPSGRSDNDLGLQAEKDQFQELRNLSLRSCLQRYNEDDRRALWYMASRCLSDLVLLLP